MHAQLTLTERGEVLELKQTLKHLSRRAAQSVEALPESQNFQTNRSPFGPTPLQYLAYFEPIENEVEKEHFWQHHKIVPGRHASPGMARPLGKAAGSSIGNRFLKDTLSGKSCGNHL